MEQLYIHHWLIKHLNIASLAKQNDEARYTYLYEQTYSKALYAAIKYVKQEDRAYDVLQDAYIKAFKSLDQTDNPEKYVSWFHMIVAHTALNDLKKRTPMLFTQLEKDYEIIMNRHIVVYSQYDITFCEKNKT